MCANVYMVILDDYFKISFKLKLKRILIFNNCVHFLKILNYILEVEKKLNLKLTLK